MPKNKKEDISEDMYRDVNERFKDMRLEKVVVMEQHKLKLLLKQTIMY